MLLVRLYDGLRPYTSIVFDKLFWMYILVPGSVMSPLYLLGSNLRV